VATYAQAKVMLRIFAPKLLKYPNVVGVGLGRKNGEPRRDWCIRVHVTRKSRRRSSASVPSVLRPPRSRKWLSPILTDVEQTGKLQLHQPLFELSSGTGLEMDTRGTAGGILTLDNNLFYVLTSGHVASPDLTAAHDLPDGNLDAGQYITCSQLSLNYDATQIVGQCVRCSSKKFPVDLALVQIDGSIVPRGSPFVESFRDLSSSRFRVNEQLRVIRSQAQGGVFTTNVPAALDHLFTGRVEYPTRNGVKVVVYSDLICYPSRAGSDSLAAGDSGSAVIDSDARLVGIHIGATEPDDNHPATRHLAYAVSSNQVRAWIQGLSLLV